MLRVDATRVARSPFILRRRNARKGTNRVGEGESVLPLQGSLQGRSCAIQGMLSQTGEDAGGGSGSNSTEVPGHLS